MELNHMRQLCRQKHIPLAVFVHQFNDAWPTIENEAAADIPLIRELLAAEDEQP